MSLWPRRRTPPAPSVSFSVSAAPAASTFQLLACVLEMGEEIRRLRIRERELLTQLDDLKLEVVLLRESLYDT